MAAILEKNGADGKPLVNPGLPANEILNCPEKLCHVSFALAYGQTENRMEGNQNVLDVIRRTASEMVRQDHPHWQVDNSYIWGGIKLGWLDREKAKAAGL
jgi:hypothetical protein